MTIPEIITGAFGLLFTWALSFWFGVFVGLHVAGKKRRKELLDQIKELEDKDNDRSNL